MFIRRMQYSGCTDQYSAQITHAAIKAYEELQEKKDEGGSPHVQNQEVEKKYQTTTEEKFL